MYGRICKLLKFEKGVFETDGLHWASGATVPTDADTGYAKGCFFTKTDGGVETTLYLNEGSVTSCDFNAVNTA